jgi:rSAM/selenodomain-associated transferase 1
MKSVNPFNPERRSGIPTAFRPCLLVFIRAPEAGRVKTRLSKRLSQDMVLELYKRFVLDVLRALGRCQYPIKVYYYPPGADSMMREWLGRGYTYHVQQGNDLGERMAAAFRSVFSEGFKQALLVGTDLPDLPERVIHDGFDALYTHNSVVGPTFDGGYYLIGFNADSYRQEIFEDVTWGTGEVFEQTLSRLRSHGHRYHLLMRWHDIDEYEDLTAFVQRNAGSVNVAPNTLEYLGHISRSLSAPLIVKGG